MEVLRLFLWNFAWLLSVVALIMLGARVWRLWMSEIPAQAKAFTWKGLRIPDIPLTAWLILATVCMAVVVFTSS